MGFSSQAGQVVCVTGGAGHLPGRHWQPQVSEMLLRSGSLGPNRELMIPDPEIGGGRDVVDAYLGAVSWSGDYEFYWSHRRTEHTASQGLPRNGGGTGHDDWCHDSHHHSARLGTLPYLSIEENIGGTLETYQYTDCCREHAPPRVRRQRLPHGYCRHHRGEADGGQHRPFADLGQHSDDRRHERHCHVQRGAMPAKNFSLDINNNFEDVTSASGSFYIGDLTPKRREVTAASTSASLLRLCGGRRSTALSPATAPRWSDDQAAAGHHLPPAYEDIRVHSDDEVLARHHDPEVRPSAVRSRRQR
jgi:hypothetical protein